MTTATERLTNSQVAERLDMSPSGVSRLRSGDRRPKPDLVHRILDTFVNRDPDLKLYGYEALTTGGEQQTRFLERIWG